MCKLVFTILFVSVLVHYYTTVLPPLFSSSDFIRKVLIHFYSYSCLLWWWRCDILIILTYCFASCVFISFLHVTTIFKCNLGLLIGLSPLSIFFFWSSPCHVYILYTMECALSGIKRTMFIMKQIIYIHIAYIILWKCMEYIKKYF